MISLGVTAVASATDSSIQKKQFGLGKTVMIISDKELEDTMKIDNSLEESCLLIKGVNETIKNDVKVQKGGFLGILLGTLGTSLLGNMLEGKRVITGSDGVIRADEGVIRGGDGVSSSRSEFLIALHPLTNFEIQKHYQSEPKFNGVYMKDNLHKIRVEAYIINLDEYESIGTNWIVVYVNGDNVTYFDRFGVKSIPE